MNKPTLFVVDDEPAMLRAVCRVCSSLYSIHSTQNAKELVQQLAEGNRFDIILSDVEMPIMSGVELFEILESRFPDVLPHVVFWSGSEDPTMESVFHNKARFLHKSDPHSLLQELSDILRVTGRM